MLTHENVMGSVAAVLMQLGDHTPRCTDILISFLPLAHMLERCCEVNINNKFSIISNLSLN